MDFFSSAQRARIASRLYCGNTIGISFDILSAVANLGFGINPPRMIDKLVYFLAADLVFPGYVLFSHSASL